MFRIGEGHDLHRLETGRPLLIGGVNIPHDKGGVGHSDADVLLHAITDALLGAIASGDIGELFPDTDEKHRGQDSSEFVKAALELVQKQGWRINNLDCTVFAQLPKLSPYKQQIRQRIAEILEVSLEQVNVKAKTGERVGPIGREEGIAATAVVLLTQN